MIRRRFLQSLLFLFSCEALTLSVASALRAAPLFTITLLDTLPIAPAADPFAYRSVPTGISEQGIVVGYSKLPGLGALVEFRPVMWNGAGEPQELWSDETFGGLPAAINNSGYVVGRYGSGTVPPLPSGGIPEGGAFLWDPITRDFADLGDLGGVRVEATDINDAGQVSGSSEALVTALDSEGNQTIEIQDRAFVWDASNGMLDLETLGGDFSRGAAINSSGQVAGWSSLPNGAQHPFIWDSIGRLNDLGAIDLSGVEQSFAFAVNDAGVVAGVEFGAGGFIWDSERGIQLIGNIIPGDINDNGQVVGGVGSDALLWEAGAGLLNLQDMIPSDSDWDLEVATAINNRGQIVGYGSFGGVTRGFLLTPVPEPSAALHLSGILLVVVMTYRRGERRGGVVPS